jgi:protein TonB
MPHSLARTAVQPADAAVIEETANDRLKRDARSWLPRSLVLAALIHFAVLSLAPEMSVADVRTAQPTDVYVVPPPLDLPPPPEQIARPAAPVVGVDVDVNTPYPDMTFEQWTPERLAAPKQSRTDARSDFEMFVPTMIAPALQNRAEVERELVRTYPTMLRDAGIGGQVDVQLWLDENGTIVQSQVARSSGYEALDAAALQVVRVMKLSPARNRNMPARVIVTVPVVFSVR